MPMEKYTDAHKELKNEARKGPEPEKSIASRDRMERSGSFGSDAPVQAGAEECMLIKHEHTLIESSRERAMIVSPESHFKDCATSCSESTESYSGKNARDVGIIAMHEGHRPNSAENHSGSSGESHAAASDGIHIIEQVSANELLQTEQAFASYLNVACSYENICDTGGREYGEDLKSKTHDLPKELGQQDGSTSARGSFGIAPDSGPGAPVTGGMVGVAAGDVCAERSDVCPVE
ncbi:hypothetical protein HPB50_004286 [Hyalomma asiaticum]|uniref:Uncharacterized protein n=1 Tax=Hyalomma asiaticum TaxID=266040 RepID=A0ACB7T5E6_HYAAI|nr:hypothetical protein HPB50_004286 [Hyalomma asiaticum]